MITGTADETNDRQKEIRWAVDGAEKGLKFSLFVKKKWFYFWGKLVFVEKRNLLLLDKIGLAHAWIFD